MTILNRLASVVFAALACSFSAFGSSPPAPPANVTATAGNAQAALNWSASSGATGYYIYKSTTSGGEASPAILLVKAPATTVTVTGLSNGTTYYFKIRSGNASGSSAYSNEASAKPTPIPAAPTGVSAAAGNSQITLNWTASSGATSYNVYTSTTSGNEALLAFGITGTSYASTGLNSGSTHYFKVAAVNASGTSVLSSEVSATLAPSAATNLTAAPGNSQASLSWTASSGATGYYIYKSTKSGGEVSPAILLAKAPATTATITGLSNGTAYYFTIRASNAGGSSAYSNEASATLAPSPPASPTATPGNTQATLNWTASSGATGYSIYKSTTSGGEVSPPVALVNAPATTATVTGLTNGTNYYFTIRANGAGGSSAYSNEVSVTPGPPAVPNRPTATPGNAQVTLNGYGSARATSYNIYRSTTFGSETLLASGVTSFSYTSTGLTNGTTYYFKVAAVNSGGTSALSNEISAKPTNQFAYVVNSQGGNISAYSIDEQTGELTGVPGSPFRAGDSARFVAINPAGTFAYEGNPGSNDVSAFSIDSHTGALSPVPGSPFAAGSRAYFVAINPAGTFAYVANYQSNNVSAFSIDSHTGALTPVPGSPFAAGSFPAFITINPAGTFAYVLNEGGATYSISAYSINPSTGALTQVPGSPFAAGGQQNTSASITINPAGTFAYMVTGEGSATSGILTYSIEPSTGALTPITGSPFALPYAYAPVAINPAGTFAYVYTGGYQFDISVLNINSSTGALSVSGSYATGGAGLGSITINPQGTFLYGLNFGPITFYIDSSTGAVGREGSIAAGSSPSDIQLTTLP
jgi:6-phosphogluconolactonase (cycloisomerase 2 family)/fibronectin type 3 domain-containing protein